MKDIENKGEHDKVAARTMETKRGINECLRLCI